MIQAIPTEEWARAPRLVRLVAFTHGISPFSRFCKSAADLRTLLEQKKTVCDIASRSSQQAISLLTPEKAAPKADFDVLSVVSACGVTQAQDNHINGKTSAGSTAILGSFGPEDLNTLGNMVTSPELATARTLQRLSIVTSSSMRSLFADGSAKHLLLLAAQRPG
jgi:hypothetical protein